MSELGDAEEEIGVGLVLACFEVGGLFDWVGDCGAAEGEQSESRCDEGL